MGNNSTTDNVSAVNLINVKKVTKRRVNMQWFKIPEKIYHEMHSIQYLEKMENVERVMIVTDRMMVQLGYAEKLAYHLRKRRNPVMIEIFADVEPDPSVDTVLNGAEAMRKFNPDTIIALGGGSAMDAAKGMWLFYENPEADFEDLRLKFADIRKRVYKFPKLGRRAKMVAIPTTSGTGSEVTSFAVITDKVNNIKYPLADYELTPDVAIIDPQFVMSVPAAVTADTGLDVLTHAIEAYVSVMATDYTDALAMKAIQMVFKYLPISYRGGDTAEGREAREKMHNASCMAGMAFANAFLGVNHSLAHKLGSEFHIPHGRANAILLPHVVEYNAQLPTKFAAFPKYKSFVADKKYAEIAKVLGLKADTVEQGVLSLVQAIKDLMKELGITPIDSSIETTTLDVPAVSAEIMRPLHDKSVNYVIDVGGDNVGGRVVGRFAKQFEQDDYDMFYVVNANREKTQTAKEVLGYIDAIEASSKLKVTGLVNNTHMLRETTVEDILKGQEVAREVSKIRNIPIKYVCCLESLVDKLPTDLEGDILPIKLYLREDWM